MKYKAKDLYSALEKIADEYIKQNEPLLLGETLNNILDIDPVESYNLISTLQSAEYVDTILDLDPERLHDGKHYIRVTSKGFLALSEKKASHRLEMQVVRISAVTSFITALVVLGIQWLLSPQ